MTSRVSIGADPELFAFNGNIPISVHNLLPGTKADPVKVPRGAIQVDGVAAEFNIEPAYTRKDFIKNITHVRKLLQLLLAQKQPTLILKAVPTVVFQSSYFSNLPAEALALGCEPDFNAYTGAKNPKPETVLPMRTGSGHIHIGWLGCEQLRKADEKSYMHMVRTIVKELDFVLYRSSHVWDMDNQRRTLYGEPGAFRYKPYGLEYRVLSNAWLNHENLMAYVFDATQAVTNMVLLGRTPSILVNNQELGWGEYNDYLRKCKIPSIQDYKF